MSYEFNTLGDLLSNPKIRPIAQDAIRRRNLKEEELWNMTLSQLKEEHFFSGEINNGIRRLYEAADSGDWYYPLYSEEECAENEARKGVSLVWFPSADPEADNRPFMLVVPGGGFVNVWNLTEGWPIAEQFNRCGYHAIEADPGKERTLPCAGGPVYYLRIFSGRIPDLPVEYEDGLSGFCPA